MKIFTSYFGNVATLKKCGVHPISIARWSPRGWDGDRLTWLAPTVYMLKEASHEEYVRMYQEICRGVNIEWLIRQLSMMAGGKDVALLCYERPNEFCHRHMLAEYLTDHGIKVTEFNEWEYVQQQAQAQAATPTPPPPERKEPEQLTLF